MNGIEYTAERNYTGGKIPVAVITCTRKDAANIDEKYRYGKKKWLRILHISWPGIVWILFIVSTRSLEIFSSVAGWLVLLGLLALCIAGVIRNYRLYWNRYKAREEKE